MQTEWHRWQVNVIIDIKSKSFVLPMVFLKQGKPLCTNCLFYGGMPILSFRICLHVCFTKWNLHFILYHSSHHRHSQWILARIPTKLTSFLVLMIFFFSLSLSLMKPNRRFCLDSLVTPICAVDCYNWHELKFLLSLIVAQRQFQFGFKWPYADKDNWTNQNSLLCLCQVNTNLVLEMPSIFFSYGVSG